MEFKILDVYEKPARNAKSRVYLTWDNWNDYSFLTLFGLIYVDKDSVQHEIGSIKIGFFGQKESERKLIKGETFQRTIYENHFSVGQSDEYYKNLNSFGEEIRDEILYGLRDIAKSPEIYQRAISENVTRISLLRSVSPTSVTGQFRRLSGGDSELTDYKFDFNAPRTRNQAERIKLTIEVVPYSMPPTNIHVIIGRNGVGKTHLINNMINSLMDESSSKKFGSFEPEFALNVDKLFANLISVSFSAFDETEPRSERRDKTQGVQYSYIGLKKIQTANEKNPGPKSTTILRNEFFTSLSNIKLSRKTYRWQEIIAMLDSDVMFQESEVKSLIEIEDSEQFKTEAFETFRRLSSGHKIVLLTLTRLVETLQERSLVLIDEPEAHLHPPLLSAFIRALSKLLTVTNGVSIIATHSPVILQEVPKSCVWKLRRAGAESKAERLEIESFGENVGVLTNEIFGLEINKSGFYKLINDSIEENQNYDDVVAYFNNHLGMEARSIIMSIISNKD